MYLRTSSSVARRKTAPSGAPNRPHPSDATVADAFPLPPTSEVHVAICVATYRRPAGLSALLQSFEALTFRSAPPRITVVVADNAPDEPASRTLGDIRHLTRWDAVYVMAHTRGIVAARNRALDAMPADADLVVFIDDDETVVPEWLDELIGTMRQTGATVTQGPVLPSYRTPPSDWIERLGIFRIGPFPQGARLNFAATGNSMVRAGVIRRNRLRFDPRFNLTGGEDEEFFHRIRERGGTVRAAARAIAWDIVPEGRMNLRWVLRRSHRMGNTLGRIAILRGRGRTLRFIKGIAATLRGVAMIVLGLPLETARIRGLMEVCRGTGMLTAFARLEFREYSERALRLDRTRES